MPIDYSKFDNIDCSDTEDEDDTKLELSDDDNVPNGNQADDKVKVWRNDGQRITIGPKGVTIGGGGTSSGATQDTGNKDQSVSKPASQVAVPTTPPPATTTSYPRLSVDNGFESVAGLYAWRQTRTDIVIYVALPTDGSQPADVVRKNWGRRLRDGSYKLVVKPSGCSLSRVARSNVNDATSANWSGFGPTTFVGRVVTDEDELEGCWEVIVARPVRVARADGTDVPLPKETFQAYLALSLRKADVGNGMAFMWWDKCFTDGVPPTTEQAEALRAINTCWNSKLLDDVDRERDERIVDVGAIKERWKSSESGDLSTAWQQAHQQVFGQAPKGVFAESRP